MNAIAFNLDGAEEHFEYFPGEPVDLIDSERDRVTTVVTLAAAKRFYSKEQSKMQTSGIRIRKIPR